MSPRLLLLADPFVRSAVERELRRSLEYHAELPSTQDRARELRDRAIVIADRQTSGRGTRDRVWESAAGHSLLASWVYPELASAIAPLLAGVAVARALDVLGYVGARLKWPNDVELGGYKVSGALAHARTGDGATLVIGIGINVSQRAEDFPASLRDRATSLARHGAPVDRLALLARVTSELDRALLAPDDALAEWRRRSAVLGHEVEVLQEGQPTLRGRAVELAADGALLVETPYGQARILAGDVTVLVSDGAGTSAGRG
ncbi:MAG: biotin--[acetyl-CoA-carboxylase] ligase [Chloroflexi bacterium]|nr:biotin--[acetyl-CoA-carboxylase] ligase [Chloroflexota bacterium]